MEDKELRYWTIDIDKIPKEKLRYFTRADSSQGVTVRVITARMSKTDPYGNTHTMWIRRTKEEKELGEALVYIGRGKEYGGPKKEQSQDNDVSPF